MADHIATGQQLANKAEKKLFCCCALFGSNYEDAAELFLKSAKSFKLGKSWDKAGSIFIKSAKCHMKLDNKFDAAKAYVDASHCYKKTSRKGGITCLKQAVTIFMEIGQHIMAAKYCKEIGIYELIISRAKLELFDIRGDSATSVIQCKQKVAQFSAQLQQYQKAIKIYEDTAQQSLNNNLLKYGVRGYLLNSGLCELCRGDIVAITNTLERYQDLDPTFSRTREYRFLADLAASIDNEDVASFTRVVKEFGSITHLESWKSTLLSRVKDALEAKVMEEDDLT
ncbi:putative NSF attachment protein [Medicago truncatula]|uniref:Putative NSF attachment protein n=1 Tax=Medicago truncatula TaxID=3880 RepID=A0A396GZU1_MEDTR|nr:alpha-soluble NSF attachment protein [Medicago truncatula]RHN46629.1 putative NSF attachment protein [Medicago truncatula]